MSKSGNSSPIANMLLLLGGDSKEMEKVLDTGIKRLKRFERDSERVGKSLTKALTLPILGFGALMLKTSGDFEQSMNKVAAITKASDEELMQMTQTARELGASTVYSASEAADAMSFLAMAGFKTNQIIASMPAVLNLAAAGALDIASAADIASNIMSGFGMSAEDLHTTVDMLAKGFTSSNTDLLQLGEAMKYVGPVSKGFGVSIEETTAAIGFLSDAGLQGSNAGTGLRNVIVKLSASAEKLGVNMYTASGTMRPLADLIEDLEKRGMSAAETMEIFGERGGPAMQVLLSRGSDALRTMTAELENAGGTAKQIADKQMEGLNGAIKKLKSAYEEMNLVLADQGINDFATETITRLTNLIVRVSELDSNTLKMLTRMAGFAAIAGPVAIGVGKITAAIRILTFTMKKNPYLVVGGIVATGLLTLAAYAGIAEGKVESLTRALKEKVLGGKDVTGSLEERKQIQEELIELAKKESDLENGTGGFETGWSAAAREKKLKQIQLSAQILREFHHESILAANAQGELNEELANAEDLVRGVLDELEPLLNGYEGLSGSVSKYSNQIDKILNQSGELTTDQMTELHNLVALRGEIEEQIKLRERLANARTMMSSDDLDSLLKGTPDAKVKVGVTYGELGKMPASIREANEAIAEYSRLFDEAMSPDQREKFKAMIDALEDLRDGYQATGSGASNMAREMSVGMELMQPAVMAFTSSFSQGLSNIAFEGEKAMKMLKNMSKYILSATFQKLATVFLTGGVSAAGEGFLGAGGGLFGLLGFADGGRPPVGIPSIVGERGPEVFVPDGPGTIIPNHKLGASSMPSSGSRELVIHIKGSLEGDYPKLVAQIQKTIRMYKS